MSREVTVAALQCALGGEIDDNLPRVEALVREAAAGGAQVILPSELFEGPYFCVEERDEHTLRARPTDAHPAVQRLAALAGELGVVIPISFYERAGHATYNSVAVADANGAILGVYRKSHIPDGPGYEEKFYFRPGDTGFKVWRTRFGVIGVGICWDQWYPECARAMALLGAEMLLYPTAIGNEPHAPDVDTKDPWQRVMIGHAVANSMPVIAANRVGVEQIGDTPGLAFYGSSFIADARGDKVAELDRHETGIVRATFDLHAMVQRRGSWGFFRDRRPELYGPLLTADGKTRFPGC
jgi:N-carbamoylputrescine amidase